MEILFTMSAEFEELVTTDYATAKLVADIHKETSLMTNNRYHSPATDQPMVYYKVSWKKGR